MYYSPDCHRGPLPLRQIPAAPCRRASPCDPRVADTTGHVPDTNTVEAFTTSCLAPIFPRADTTRRDHRRRRGRSLLFPRRSIRLRSHRDCEPISCNIRPPLLRSLRLQRSCVNAYYQRRLAIPSPRAVSDDELAKKITAIHTESKGTYGSPRVHRALRKQGTECGKRRVRKLMGQAGLEGRVKKRWRKTPIAAPEAEAALDLIRRYFGPGVEVDTRYVGDITYIATWEGWPGCSRSPVPATTGGGMRRSVHRCRARSGGQTRTPRTSAP